MARIVIVFVMMAFHPVFAAGPARPCDTSADCLAGQECYFPLIQDCTQQPEGYCVSSVPPCDPDSGLVCGCDGRTYFSECDAEGQTWIEHIGVCASSTSCGGQTCTGNNFCQLPFGACNQFGELCSGELWTQLYETLGVCTPYPASCPPDSAPVCSCGFPGTTYLNECEAARALQSVERAGSCGSGCLGFGGGGCPVSEVCVQECTACWPDFPGRCEPQPVACDNSCAPVCGCGGEWFRNRCEGLLGFPFAGFTQETGCDEVGAVRFNSKTDMLFASSGVGVTFNVYRAPLTPGAAPGSWNCVEQGLASGEATMNGTPAPGETWVFAVTQIDAGIEGPLGWGGTGCTERANATPCPP